MDGVPRSKQFDDVYFSAENGLAETRHVFLDGNNLAERWERWRGDFTICETGFGTGLNFLAALRLWREMKASNPALGVLHFISFEKYPLEGAFIENALAHWQGDIGQEVLDMLSVYPHDLQCFDHELAINGDVVLQLCFTDVNEVMGRISFWADCWFLDGFRPSTNPEMWTDTVFQNMARLSVPGASFATFTSAGFVRRGLAAAGFSVRKVPGYGRKREMSVGEFTGGHACA